VRQKVADFYVRTQALQHTGNRTLSALSRGKTPGPEASPGKLVGAVLLQEMASYGIELEGMAGGLIDESHAPQQGAWQERYLGIPGLRIAGGTDEVLRNIIAERVLGLPSEARADKGIPFSDIPTGSPSR
jgi:alkylation response protein AidB-like acyl-CoA dehydrogenase